MSVSAGLTASLAYASYLIKVGMISLGALGVTGILRSRSFNSNGGYGGGGGYAAGYGGGYGGSHSDYGGHGGGGYGHHATGGYSGEGAYGSGYRRDGGAYGRETDFKQYPGRYGSGNKWNDWYRDHPRDRVKDIQPKPLDKTYTSDDEYYKDYYKSYYDNYYKNYWNNYYDKTSDNDHEANDFHKIHGPKRTNRVRRSVKRNLRKSLRPKKYNLHAKKLNAKELSKIYTLETKNDEFQKHDYNNGDLFYKTTEEDRILQTIKQDDVQRCGLRLVCELAGVTDRLLSRDEFDILKFISNGGDALYSRIRPGEGVLPNSPVLTDYKNAALLGRSGEDCSHIFNGCPYTADQMMGAVHTLEIF